MAEILATVIPFKTPGNSVAVESSRNDNTALVGATEDKSVVFASSSPNELHLCECIRRELIPDQLPGSAVDNAYFQADLLSFLRIRRAALSLCLMAGQDMYLRGKNSTSMDSNSNSSMALHTQRVNNFPCSNGSGARIEENEFNLEVLLSYYKVLSTLEQRGVRELNGYVFSWKTLIVTGKNDLKVLELETSSSLIAFEREIVLYNVAAMYSAMGHELFEKSISQIDSLTEEHVGRLQSSYKYHRIVATILNYLRTNGIEEFLAFMDRDQLCAMEHVALAQAQVSYLEFAIASSKKFPQPQFSVHAKIAASAAESVWVALEKLKTSSQADDYIWNASLIINNLILRVKSEYFEGMAARKSAMQSNIGFNLAKTRFEYARNICEEAVNLVSTDDDIFLINKVLNPIRQISDEIEVMIVDVENQLKNSGVLEQKLGVKDLVPIATLQRQLLDATEVIDNMLERVKDQRILFIAQNYILSSPTFANEQSSLSDKVVCTPKENESRSAHTTMLHELCTELNEQAKEELNARNVYRAAYSEDTLEIPESLWALIERCQEENLVGMLTQQQAQYRVLTQVAGSIMLECHENLKNNIKLDEEFRLSHPEYAGTKATDIQKSVRDNMERESTLLSNASLNDEYLFSKLNRLSSNNSYLLLTMTRAQLEEELIIFESKRSQVRLELCLYFMNELSSSRNHNAIQNIFLQQIFNEVKNISQRITQVIDERKTILNNFCENASIGFEQCHIDVLKTLESQKRLLRDLENINEVYDREHDNAAHSCHKNSTDNSAASSLTEINDSCTFLEILETKLNDLEKMKKHLAEGFAFYEAIIPRLQHTEKSAKDISLLLALERVEFEDKMEPNTLSVQQIEEMRKQETLDMEFCRKLVEDEIVNSGAIEERRLNQLRLVEKQDREFCTKIVAEEIYQREDETPDDEIPCLLNTESIFSGSRHDQRRLPAPQGDIYVNESIGSAPSSLTDNIRSLSGESQGGSSLSFRGIHHNRVTRRDFVGNSTTVNTNSVTTRSKFGEGSTEVVGRLSLGAFSSSEEIDDTDPMIGTVIESIVSMDEIDDSDSSPLAPRHSDSTHQDVRAFENRRSLSSGRLAQSPQNISPFRNVSQCTSERKLRTSSLSSASNSNLQRSLSSACIVEQVFPNQIPVPIIDEEKVSRLVDMGFDAELAISALSSCDNNENDALNLLLEEANS